jgi:DNA primase large subunit
MIDFKDTLAKFTSTLNFQEKGKFSSQPQKISKGNTIQVQAASKANTWIKSNQSLLFTVVRLLKNPFLNLVRKMMSQSLRVTKGLNLNIAKKRLIPHQYFHFLMP